MQTKAIFFITYSINAFDIQKMLMSVSLNFNEVHIELITKQPTKLSISSILDTWCDIKSHIICKGITNFQAMKL